MRWDSMMTLSMSFKLYSAVFSSSSDRSTWINSSRSGPKSSGLHAKSIIVCWSKSDVVWMATRDNRICSLAGSNFSVYSCSNHSIESPKVNSVSPETTASALMALRRSRCDFNAFRASARLFRTSQQDGKNQWTTGRDHRGHCPSSHPAGKATPVYLEEACIHASSLQSSLPMKTLVDRREMMRKMSSLRTIVCHSKMVRQQKYGISDLSFHDLSFLPAESVKQ